MTVNPQIVRADSYAEIGEAIHRNAETIVARWCTRVLEEFASAERVHHSVLQDHLLQFMRNLGNNLCASDNADDAQHKTIAATHGQQRWDAGWSLTEVVQDYQILRLVLADFLEEELERPLHGREIMALGLGLDDATAASVSAYVTSREQFALRIEKQLAAQAAEATETLRQHANELQELNRRKDAFLAVLGHELRNPLAAVRNALHVLGLDSRPETVKWARGIMDRQLQVQIRLVDDLLDVARIGQGKITLDRAPVNLSACIQETADAHRHSLTDAGLDLSVDLPADPVWIDGDRTRIGQVLSNLLHNAQKFTDKGGCIIVRLTNLGNTQARVETIDTGIGIAPEMLDRVFEPFVQGDGQNNRRHGGLGLGLALVKGVVRLHGGDVDVQSSGLGHGANFRIFLPIIPAP